MNFGTSAAAAPAVGRIPYLLRWSDPAAHISVELLTASLQEITAPDTQPVLLLGIVSDGDSRTWTVLFTESCAPDSLTHQTSGPLAPGIIGLAGPDDLCANILASLPTNASGLPRSLLLITTAADTASMQLWNVSSGEKTSLTQFPAGFDALRRASFQPFETKHLAALEPAADRARVPSPVAVIEPDLVDARPVEAASPRVSSGVTVRLEVPRWVWIAAFLLLAVYGGIRYAPEFRREPQAPPPVRTRNVPLGIQVAQHEKNLQILWDLDAVKTATSGTLKVTDGDERVAIPLSRMDLAAGRITYLPRSDSIAVEFTLFGPDGEFSDSARILMSRPDPLPARRIVPASPAAPADERATVNAPETPADGQSDPDSRRTRFALPNPASEREPALAAAPPSVDTRSIAAAHMPPLLPPAQSQRLPVPEIPDRNTEPAMVTFHPPVPTRQVRPMLPNVLRHNLFSPAVVEVTVSVDESGRVVSARTPVYEGAALHIAQFAKDAAQRWRFRPALRNDRPVASEYRIRFTFVRNE
jgi:hypothetical protein